MDNEYEDDIAQTLYIKELDPDIIPPSTADMRKEGKGCKLVLIGRPGCFEAGTKVLMHDGTTKKVEDVEMGDEVMGDDSTKRTVVNLCRGYEDMFKIVPVKGDPIVVNRGHTLLLKASGYDGKKTGDIVEITVNDFLQKSEKFKSKHKWFRSGVDYTENPVEFDPYIFGYWLGDGTSKNTQITTMEKEVIDYISNNLPDTLTLSKHKAPLHYSIIQRNCKKNGNVFLNFLRENNILNNKHIPHHYKCNSRENRLQLLAGLLDADGSLDTGCFDIVLKSEALFDDMIDIARSLGFSAYKSCVTKQCTNSPSGNHSGNYFRCSISGNVDEIPCKVLRKQASPRLQTKNVLVTGFTIEPIGEDNYYGFTLDGNHRFLLGDYSVVRNSGKSSAIASLLYAKKHIFPVAMVMSGTEDTTGFFKKFIPSTFVFNSYSEDMVKKFIDRQKLAREYVENPWAVLLIDDCTEDKKIFNSTVQQEIYKHGRHLSMWSILGMQHAMDLPSSIRTSIDGVFIFREPLFSARKSIWENYASVIPKEYFHILMDRLTDDHTAIFILNSTTVNDWHDCVFWYKAPLVPPGWKFGCKDYKEYHNERYDENYPEMYNRM